MNRQPMVAGNWKMHGSPESINQLMDALTEQDLEALTCEVLVCPPALFIEQVKRLTNDKIKVGAQNISEHHKGAFTGEVAPDMIKSLGCQHAIVGHSERRQLFHETNEQVAQKVKALLDCQLTPILCVGETLQQRDAEQTMTVVIAQLNAVLEVVGIDAFEQLVIAYEPVWAIGTGKTASSEQAQQVHAEVRQWLSSHSEDVASKVRILYGGSVKSENAAELFGQKDIDGGLIGGASLKADDFYQICKSAG